MDTKQELKNQEYAIEMLGGIEQPSPAFNLEKPPLLKQHNPESKNGEVGLGWLLDNWELDSPKPTINDLRYIIPWGEAGHESPAWQGHRKLTRKRLWRHEKFIIAPLETSYDITLTSGSSRTEFNSFSSTIAASVSTEAFGISTHLSTEFTQSHSTEETIMRRREEHWSYKKPENTVIVTWYLIQQCILGPGVFNVIPGSIWEKFAKEGKFPASIHVPQVIVEAVLLQYLDVASWNPYF